jgi:hypothetical protein
MPRHYEYVLRVEIPADEIQTLLDALPDEPLALRERLGAPELDRRIESGALVYEARSEERYLELDADVVILSVYLSQYVVAREYVVEPTRGAPVIDGWKVVGRAGESIRLRLDLEWDVQIQAIVDKDEDLREVAARWGELPRWAQDALRQKHPTLQRL